MNKNIKIGIGPKGRVGGVSYHIENIIKHSKHNLSMFPIFHPLSVRTNIRKISQINYFIREKKYENTDPYGLLLSKFILPKKNDIIHLHGHPWWPEIYKKRNDEKYIHTVHQVYKKEDFKTKKKWDYAKWLNKLLIKSCNSSNIVISVSKWQQKTLQKLGVDSIYIPNATDLKICEKGDEKRFREKYKINDDFVLFGGDLRHYKRPILLIKLAKRNPDKLFIMKGKNVSKTNVERVLDLKIPKNILCLGQIPYQDLIDAFAASKVMVLTSRNETFGIVILEAMALKKVVVGANNAGSKEIISDGKDGFLFEPDNIDDLEKKFLLAWDNPSLGENGYKKVKENFDWKVVIKSVDKVYEELMI